MYKNNSRGAQGRAFRPVVKDTIAASGGDPKDDIERLRNLRLALVALDDHIVATEKNSPLRAELGAKKRALADECTALKRKLHGVPKSNPGPATFERTFVEIAREHLTKWQFDQILRATHDRLESPQNG